MTQPQIEDLDPKKAGETLLITFNFRRWLASGETISAPAVTSVVEQGADPTPSGMISGTATTASPKAQQKIVAGIAGTTYLLNCQVDTSLGQRLILIGRLPVV